MSTELWIAIGAVIVLVVVYIAATVSKSSFKKKSESADSEKLGASAVACDTAANDGVSDGERIVNEENTESETLNVSADYSDELIGEINGKTVLVINRVPFSERLAAQPDSVKGYFNDIYNEFTSYKRVNARISKKCASFRLGRELIAKIFVKGKTMKLALALVEQDVADKQYFQKDMTEVKTYADVPFVIKVKSDRAVKNALELISALAEKYAMEKKARFKRVDGVALATSSDK